MVAEALCHFTCLWAPVLHICTTQTGSRFIRNAYGRSTKYCISICTEISRCSLWLPATMRCKKCWYYTATETPWCFYTLHPPPPPDSLWLGSQCSSMIMLMYQTPVKHSFDKLKWTIGETQAWTEMVFALKLQKKKKSQGNIPTHIPSLPLLEVKVSWLNSSLDSQRLLSLSLTFFMNVDATQVMEVPMTENTSPLQEVIRSGQSIPHRDTAFSPI